MKSLMYRKLVTLYRRSHAGQIRTLNYVFAILLYYNREDFYLSVEVLQAGMYSYIQSTLEVVISVLVLSF